MRARRYREPEGDTKGLGAPSQMEVCREQENGQQNARLDQVDGLFEQMFARDQPTGTVLLNERRGTDRHKHENNPDALNHTLAEFGYRRVRATKVGENLADQAEFQYDVNQQSCAGNSPEILRCDPRCKVCAIQNQVFNRTQKCEGSERRKLPVQTSAPHQDPQEEQQNVRGYPKIMPKK